MTALQVHHPYWEAAFFESTCKNGAFYRHDKQKRTLLWKAKSFAHTLVHDTRGNIRLTHCPFLMALILFCWLCCAVLFSVSSTMAYLKKSYDSDVPFIFKESLKISRFPNISSWRVLAAVLTQYVMAFMCFQTLPKNEKYALFTSKRCLMIKRGS